MWLFLICFYACLCLWCLSYLYAWLFWPSYFTIIGSNRFRPGWSNIPLERISICLCQMEYLGDYWGHFQLRTTLRFKAWVSYISDKYTLRSLSEWGLSHILRPGNGAFLDASLFKEGSYVRFPLLYISWPLVCASLVLWGYQNYFLIWKIFTWLKWPPILIYYLSRTFIPLFSCQVTPYFLFTFSIV